MTGPSIPKNTLVTSFKYLLQARRFLYIKIGSIEKPQTPTERQEITKQNIQLAFIQQGISFAKPGTLQYQIDTASALVADALVNKPLEEEFPTHHETFEDADEQILQQAINDLRQMGACDEAIELIKLIKEEIAGSAHLESKIQLLCSLIDPDTLQTFKD